MKGIRSKNPLTNLRESAAIAASLLLTISIATGCFDNSGRHSKNGSTDTEHAESAENNFSQYVPGHWNHAGYMKLSHNEFRDSGQQHLNMFGIQIKALLITMTSIEVHSELQGWITVVDYGEKGKTVDLMQFKKGRTAELSYFNLEPDIYTQMRIHLTSENILVIEKNGTYMMKELRVPKWIAPEIKVVGSFEILDSGLTSLVMKFDPFRSIHFAPGQGFMLKPTFKILEINTSPSVTETISSADGDEINIFGELCARFPAGAFPGDTEIGVTTMGLPSAMPFSSTFILGSAYNFEPEGTHLAINMELIMNYSDSEVIENNVDESSLNIYSFNDNTGVWSNLSGTTDIDQNTVTSSVGTFALFAVGGDPLTAPKINPAEIINAGNSVQMSDVPLKAAAKIVDGDGILNAYLYYRETGDIAFNIIEMCPSGDDWFEAVIPLSSLRDQLTPTGIELFIESADNSEEVSFAPVTSSLSPHLYAYNPDLDSDGMNDRWEVENALNIATDDSALDPDNDGFTNIEEYVNNTDPQVPEMLPVPEDIDSLCSVDWTEKIWNGSAYDFASVNTVNSVLPPNSAEYIGIDYDISFIRTYIIAGNPITIANKTDTIEGETGEIEYIEPETGALLYDDHLHIDEFYTIINGRQWNPLPDIKNFDIDYTADAWNTNGGFYSENFSFFIEN